MRSRLRAVRSVVVAVAGAALLLVAAVRAGDRVDCRLLFAIPEPTSYYSLLAAGGDLDGDGTPDLYETWPGMPDGGRVRLLSGADSSEVWSVVGPGGMGNDFGAAMAVVGDLDGRGLPDLLVGAPGGWTGIPEIDQPTYALVLAGEDGAVLFDSGPQDPDAAFGLAVVALPDLDGDGAPDFAVGEGPFPPAQAYTVYSGDTGAILHRFEGDDEDMLLGLVPVADVDGDGRPDLALGRTGPMVGRSYTAGRVSVLSGATFEEIRSIHGSRKGFIFGPDLWPAGPPGTASPTFLALARDFQEQVAEVFVIDAASGRILGSLGPHPWIVIHLALDLIEDQDGDGFPEVLRTEDTLGDDGLEDYGYLVGVRSGRTGAPLFSRRGWAQEQIQVGTFVPRADWDGDGREDLLVYDRYAGHYGELRGYRPETAQGRPSVRVALQRDPDVLPRPVRGSLTVGLSGPLQPLHLEIEDPSPSFAAPVHLEDPPGSGQFVAVGDLVPAGAGLYGLDTRGRDVPVAIRRADLDGLAGRRFLVGEPAAPALLATIPSPLDPDFAGRARLRPPPGAAAPRASGTVRVVTRADPGTTRLDLRARGLPGGAAYVAWVEDAPGSGAFAEAGPLERGRLRLDTALGNALPGFAAGGPALTGRRLEVRDGAVVVLQGVLP